MKLLDLKILLLIFFALDSAFSQGKIESGEPAPETPHVPPQFRKSLGRYKNVRDFAQAKGIRKQQNDETEGEVAKTGGKRSGGGGPRKNIPNPERREMLRQRLGRFPMAMTELEADLGRSGPPPMMKRKNGAKGGQGREGLQGRIPNRFPMGMLGRYPNKRFPFDPEGESRSGSKRTGIPNAYPQRAKIPFILRQFLGCSTEEECEEMMEAWAEFKAEWQKDKEDEEPTLESGDTTLESADTTLDSAGDSRSEGSEKKIAAEKVDDEPEAKPVEEEKPELASLKKEEVEPRSGKKIDSEEPIEEEQIDFDEEEEEFLMKKDESKMSKRIDSVEPVEEEDINFEDEEDEFIKRRKRSIETEDQLEEMMDEIERQKRFIQDQDVNMKRMMRMLEEEEGLEDEEELDEEEEDEY